MLTLFEQPNYNHDGDIITAYWVIDVESEKTNVLTEKIVLNLCLYASIDTAEKSLELATRDEYRGGYCLKHATMEVTLKNGDKFDPAAYVTDVENGVVLNGLSQTMV